mmetsp:Transcript_99167/g.318186  ORF Transcript_99167/g.318186 Transcript_99167/m.318186 type:complete len:435 (+) Transcript_99167:174-1478(+)
MAAEERAGAAGMGAKEGVVDTRLMPSRVHWGAPAAQALPRVLARLGCRRAVLLVSRSLRTGTGAIDEIARALGDSCAAIWDGMPAHTPREAVLDAAAVARAANADVIVTIGGGSLTDGAKVVRIALAIGATTPQELGRYAGAEGPKRAREGGKGASRRLSLIPQVVIPTTLSAGEFAPWAGCTDSETRTKEAYLFSEALPVAVIFDPALACRTPEKTFLGTGVRAVDHCVEALCSHDGNPYSDNLAAGALTLLVRGLRRVKVVPTDLEARSACQLGIFQAAQASHSGPHMGASHAIGHILGPLFDVPHGETSCVALPGVLRWNAQTGAGQLERQCLVVRAFAAAGAAPLAASASASAAECVAELVRDLGLPGSLAAVGVQRGALEEAARRTMQDPLVEFNPRRINDWRDVLEILELCGPFASERGDQVAERSKL